MFAPKPTSSTAGAEERRCRDVRLLDHEVAGATRRERAAEIGVRLAQVRGHRFDHGVRHLGSAGTVEERERPIESRESRPHGRHVE